MPTLRIDNREVSVPEGTTIMQAADKIGIYIPRFCYYPGLSIAGSCRICVVEVEKMPKLMTACSTLAADDMVVHTDTQRVRKSRRGIMEFLLINHPLDCPVCDQAGECDLQDFSYLYGAAESRFREQKIVQAKKDVGEQMLLYADRCIMCSRCIRFCNEISGTGEVNVFNRGAYSEIDIFPGKRLDNKLAGNIADICPVGAFLTKDFLFKSRVWNLTVTNSVCPRCSRGCPITVETLENEIMRIKPRISGTGFQPVSTGILPVASNRQDACAARDLENTLWICDDGRYGYKFVHSPERLKTPMKRISRKLAPTSWEDALKTIRQNLNSISAEHGSRAIAGLGSAFFSNEENNLLRELIDSVLGSRNIALMARRPREKDITFKGGFTIEGDKSPNATGAIEALKGKRRDLLRYETVFSRIGKGEIQAVYILGGDPDYQKGGVDVTPLRRAKFIVVHDIFPSELTLIADVVLPSATFAEKSGTFTNSRGKQQKFDAAIRAPGEVIPDSEVLKDLIRFFK